MIVELKNVKHSEFASEETNCFQATIYVDVVKSGEVRNDGHGGCNFYRPHGLEAQLNAIAATLPPVNLNRAFTGMTEVDMVQQDSDILIGDLLDAWLDRRALKRLCAKKTVFRKPGEKYADGEYNTISMKFCPAVKSHLLQKYGDTVQILNEMVAA